MQAVVWSSNLHTAVKTLKQSSVEQMDLKEIMKSFGLTAVEEKSLVKILKEKKDAVSLSQWL